MQIKKSVFVVLMQRQRFVKMVFEWYLAASNITMGIMGIYLNGKVSGGTSVSREKQKLKNQTFSID